MTTYYYDDESQDFIYYEPTTVQWTDYYEQPVVDLYSYEPYTDTYSYVAQPSPYVDYSYAIADTCPQEYASYEPTPAVWSQYFDIPEVPLFYYETSTNNYYQEVEPSPYVTYYQWSEPSQGFVEYEPSPV